MKRTLTQTLPIVFALAFGAFVLFMTTAPSRTPIVYRLRVMLGNTAIGDSIGHGGLFGLLTLFGYLALARRFSWRVALLLAMAITLTLSTGTEMSQHFLPGRDMTLSDLLANWLGIFIAATAISLTTRRA